MCSYTSIAWEGSYRNVLHLKSGPASRYMRGTTPRIQIRKHPDVYHEDWIKSSLESRVHSYQIQQSIIWHRLGEKKADRELTISDLVFNYTTLANTRETIPDPINISTKKERKRVINPVTFWTRGWESNSLRSITQFIPLQLSPNLCCSRF